MFVSVLVTVSRPQFVDLVRQNLSGLDLDGFKAELTLMGDNKALDLHSIADAKGFGRFERIRIFNTNNGPPSKDVVTQRSRISYLRNVSRETIGDTDLVFSFEDDTVVPKNALTKLFESGETSGGLRNKVGLISGIQVARYRKVLGAWYTDDYQFPTEFTSLGSKEIVTPIAEVDGTGFYCYLTPTKLYKAATYGWREPVGPDVWYGLRLKGMGYQNYVDQSVVCPHVVNENLTLTPDNTEVEKLRFAKNQHGIWNHGKVPQKK